MHPPRLLALLAWLLPGALVPQDLHDERGEIFSERGLPVGSLVSIVFDEALVANYNANFSRQSQRQVQPDAITGEMFDFFPKGGVGGTSTERNQSQVNASRAFKGTLAAQVQAFDARSLTYRLQATHTMKINGRSDSVQLSGVVAARDVSAARTVSSRKVAGIFITYQGYAIGRDRVFAERDFTNFAFSVNTNNTNAVQLTPEKKKALWLEQFNLLINELF